MKRRLSKRPCAGLLTYASLVAAAVIFTQAFRSPLSAVTLVFVLLLPIAELLCFLISVLFVGGRISDQKPVIGKLESHRCTLRLTNRSILPVSCAELTLSIPDEPGSVCEIRRQTLAIPPLSEVRCDIPLRFRYRGVYTVGVRELLLYDWFRLIRIRKKLHAELTVRVLPSLLPPCGALPAADNGDLQEQSSDRNSQTEFGDIRPYLPGDSFKTIHWKLSSKTEELQIRKYLPESGRTVTIFCDFGGHDGYPFPPDILPCAADRIAEEALSSAREAAAAGYSGKLLWSAPGSPDGLAVTEFTDPNGMTKTALALAEADAVGASAGMSGLPQLNIGSTLLLVTAFRSTRTEEAVRSAVSLFGAERVSVCLCDLSEMLSGDPQSAYRRDLDALSRRLTSSGIRVTVPNRRKQGDRNHES